MRVSVLRQRLAELDIPLQYLRHKFGQADAALLCFPHCLTTPWRDCRKLAGGGNPTSLRAQTGCCVSRLRTATGDNALVVTNQVTPIFVNFGVPEQYLRIPPSRPKPPQPNIPPSHAAKLIKQNS